MRILKYVKFDVKNTWAEKLNSDCLRGRSWSCGSVDALFGILVIDFALHRKKIKTQKNILEKYCVLARHFLRCVVPYLTCYFKIDLVITVIWNT